MCVKQNIEYKKLTRFTIKKTHTFSKEFSIVILNFSKLICNEFIFSIKKISNSSNN